MERKLKNTAIVLFVILICLVGFGGIYIRNKGLTKNLLPNFELGSELNGKRITTFILDDATKEVIYDSEGNVVEAIPDGEDENNYRKESQPLNLEERKTAENYIKSKEIITKRLDSLGVTNYQVRVDKDKGNIYIELNENKNTDMTLSQLLEIGKFELIDTDDLTELMDSKDIQDARVMYNNTNSGISVYLTISFTKEGAKKFEQITRDYAKVSDTEENATQKTITINLDGEKFLSTYFSSPIENGELTVLVGKESTDTETITENITSAQYYATIISNGELPLTYKNQSSEYINSLYINNNYIYILILVLLAIVIIMTIYTTIRYRLIGLMTSIISIGAIALITIIIRCVGINIGIETIISGAVILMLIAYINFVTLNKLTKEDTVEERKTKLNNVYKEISRIIIAVLIPAIVLTYNSMYKLGNIGMTLFWGIIIVLIMNLLLTRTVLLNSVKK